jgi:hypothetical protein
VHDDPCILKIYSFAQQIRRQQHVDFFRRWRRRSSRCLRSKSLDGLAPGQLSAGDARSSGG